MEWNRLRVVIMDGWMGLKPTVLMLYMPVCGMPLHLLYENADSPILYI